MIEYTFHFNEGMIKSKAKTEEDDLRISEALELGGVLSLPDEKFDLYVNMALVKCVVREIIDEQSDVHSETTVESAQS